MDDPPKHLGFTHSQKNIFISIGDLKSALLAFFCTPIASLNILLGLAIIKKLA